MPKTRGNRLASVAGTLAGLAAARRLAVGLERAVVFAGLS
jgi:hypothetical protein